MANVRPNSVNRVFFIFPVLIDAAMTLHYLAIHAANSEGYAPCKKGPPLLAHDGDKASLLCIGAM